MVQSCKSSMNLSETSTEPPKRALGKSKGADGSTYTIVYDFGRMGYETYNVRPEVNHPVIFKVQNINRLAYDVTISSRDSILVYADLPPVGVGEKEESQVQQKAMEAVLENKSEVPVAKATAADFKPQTETQKNPAHLADQFNLGPKISLHRDEIADQQKKLAEYEKELNSIETGTIDSGVAPHKDPEKLKMEIEKTKMEIQRKKDVLETLKIKDEKIRHYQEKVFMLDKQYDTLVYNYRIMWRSFRMNSQLLSIAQNPSMNYSDYMNEKKKIVDTLLKQYPFRVQREAVGNFYNVYQDFKKQYHDVLNDWEIEFYLTEAGIVKMQRPVRRLNEQAEDMMKTLKGRDLGKVITRMEALVDAMSSSETYEISSAPIQPARDMVVFDIDIKYKGEGEFHNNRRFPYWEYVRKGIRYDLSTGIVWGIGVNDFVYHAESVGGDSVTIVGNCKTNQYLPVIAAMFHSSFRTWRTASMAFTLGASISTSELDIHSLFPGLSLMLGKEEKFILTAGPAFRKIDYLHSNYRKGKNYHMNAFSGEVPTEKTFRVGAFIGISYNLTKKQKSFFNVNQKKN